MTTRTREEVVATLKAQLDRWNADMARLEAQAKAASADARKRYDEQLKTFKDRREKALYNLRLLENASAAAWAEVARGAEDAWQRMGEAVASASKHFGKR